MYKTSAKRREQVRACKRKNPPAPDAAYQLAWYHKNSNALNERKRAARHRNARRNTTPRSAIRELFAGLTIVAAPTLAKDQTRWRGPGWIHEVKLETLANEILQGTQAAASKLRQRLTQADRAKKEGREK